MVSISSIRQVPIAEQLTPFEVTIASTDGAQTNLAISPAIGGSSRLLIHAIYATVGAATAVNVACRVGFGAATLPAAALAGVAGILLSHTNISPGSGLYGIPGMGAAGEELRITCGAPTSGNLVITYLYEIVAA